MKYRKKPVVIEAIQWKGDNFIEIDNFITIDHETYPSQGIIKIPTLEGTMDASANDYIIKGVNGEFYPCKPDIFEKTYEKAEKNSIYQSVNINLKDTKVFHELLAALKFIFDDERIDKNIRDEYFKRLSNHFS